MESSEYNGVIMEKELLKAHQREAEMRFNAFTSERPGSMDSDSMEYISIAHELFEVVRSRKYQSISKVLSKMSVPSGKRLKVKECTHNGFGGESRLYISGLHKEYDVFGALRFENSCEGAWQAYLLHQLWHSLPLYWHANYSRRVYLFTSEDYSYIIHEGIDDGPFIDALTGELIQEEQREPRVEPDLSHFNISPVVFKGESHYYVTCCYWTEFGGLIREYVELTLSDGYLIDFINFKNTTLYEYNCGIMY